MKKENRIFVALYSEDAFQGITIPIELKYIIVHILNNSQDVIDDYFEDYDQYRDFEVEMASYAKDGSYGTKDVDNLDELLEVFKHNSEIINQIKKLTK